MHSLRQQLSLIGAFAILAAVLGLRAPEVRSAGGRADRFTAIQFSPVPGAVKENRARLGQLIERAAQQGARFVALPELSVTGSLTNSDQWHRDQTFAEKIPGPTTDFFGEYAKRLGLWLVIPVVEDARPYGGYYVTTVLLDDRGTIRYKYRKITQRINGDDGKGIVRGSPRTILESVDARGRRIGILSGDDLQTGVPRLAGRGADTILIAANLTSREPINWRQVCRDLSREYQVNLVLANNSSADPQSAGGLYLSGGIRLASEAKATGERLSSASLMQPPRLTRVPSSLGLPATVPLPTYYEVTPEVVELGRALFFDRSLSKDGRVSCASCHQPTRAFTTSDALGAGIYGRKTQRNVPSLLNVAFRGALFWDGYASMLENQAKYPMSHASEMGVHYLDMVEQIRRQPRYAERFRRVMKVRRIEFDDISRALASYQRTLISGNSAFDRYFYRAEQGALSPSAKRGLQLFTGKANCASCHTFDDQSALFMDQDFHNTGVGYDARQDAYADLGHGAISYEGKNGLFATPSLRNVGETAPYMHDGSLATLEAVIEFYNRGGNQNSHLDPLLKPLHLTREETNDLVAFLRSLSGAERFSATGQKLNPGPQAAQGQFPHSPTFAAIQFQPVAGRVEDNRRHLARLIRKAASHGASFIVLPEYALTGPLSDLRWPPARVRELAVRQWEPSLRFFGALAKELGVWLAAPVLEYESEHRKLHVTTLLFSDQGQLSARHQKLAPLQERGDGEAASGHFKFIRSVDTPFGRVGILSGDDMARGIPRLAELGAATIMISASWQSSDVVRWLDECQELAKQYKVNLVISNLQERRARPSHLDGAVILSDGSVRPQDQSPVRDEILYATITRPEPPFKITPPLGLPSVPQPTHRVLTKESVALGQKLFFDKSLSRDGTVSCATCHEPQKAFANHEKLSRGVFGRVGRVNVPSLVNNAYRSFLAWDGRVASIESQIRHATHGFPEMDMPVSEILKRLAENREYRDDFRLVTGRDTITFDDVAQCIADFQRTIIMGDAPFDRFYYGGQKDALSEQAQQGLALFRTKANCATCHQITDKYALFADDDFHNTGIGYHQRFDYLGYAGDGIEGNLATKNKFRGEYFTPSLRNVALTAPYMHDGSLPTLEEVVRFYNRGGMSNPFLDKRLKPLQLSEDEMKALVEFLRSLTSESQFETAHRPVAKGH